MIAALVKELTVLVPPDKRVSRGLKNIHRRKFSIFTYWLGFEPFLSQVLAPPRLLAEKLDIPVFQVPNTGLRDFELPAAFKTGCLPNSEIASNLLITASFGYLVPQSMLAHFLPLNTLNVHPSLLPKYRGAAPIQWSIMNGDSDTGVTIQSLGKRFDEGRLLAQREVVSLADSFPQYAQSV